MKQRVLITTVDPATRRIEGVLKDGAVIQIALYEIPAQFRWPKVNEYWTVTREANFWYLGSAHEMEDETFPVEAMEPGDTKVAGDRIFDALGNRLLTGVELNTFGLTSAQIDAAYPGVVADSCVISDSTNHVLLVRQNGNWYKTAILTLIT